MVLGGMRRCEVLGLRLEDLRVGQRRVFIGEGKGGHQRIVSVSARFFTAAAAYLEAERMLVLDVVTWARSIAADRVDLSATPIGQRIYEKLGFTVTSAPRMKLVL